MTSTRIALSGGGGDADLAAYGLGIEHVNDLFVWLAKALLQDGRSLAFGGDLTRPEGNLTQTLLDVATRWVALNKTSDETQPDTWPLANYAAWSYHQAITPAHDAGNRGVCRFVRVDPPGVDKAELDRRLPAVEYDPKAQAHRANALSEMRRLSTEKTQARVLLAGKISGAAGWIPGIAEELLMSVRAKQPVLVLGGFGGCARLLADFLADPDADWPVALTFGAARAHGPLSVLIGEPDNAARADAAYAALEAELRAFRSAVHTPGKVFGVPDTDWIALLRRDSPADVVRRVRRALDDALGKPDPAPAS